MDSRATIFRYSNNMTQGLVVLALSLSIVVALGGLLMACLKHAEEETEHLRCLKCGYILKGLSEPRCPECGKQI